MASHHRAQVITLYACMLLLHGHFVWIEASRQPKFHPPANSKLVSSIGGYSSNRYKKIETEAFRPTSPGHSPGVGHHDPPGYT